MARPTLYPRQLVVQIGDSLGERIEADAAARPDKSKSAAARRLLELGGILDDALKAGVITGPQPLGGLDRLIDKAEAVR